MRRRIFFLYELFDQTCFGIEGLVLFAVDISLVKKMYNGITDTWAVILIKPPRSQIDLIFLTLLSSSVRKLVRKLALWL